MIELTTFGALELRRDGTDVRSALNQPRRLALLVYLRLAAPGGFVSRDRLMALFWPESDAERGRNALRQSLHFLRRSLGEDAVVTRSEQEVGVSPNAVWCDAVAFSEALAEDRLEDALELYRGELLPGFVVDDAPEVERWLEEERGHLAHRAVEAARELVRGAEARGDLRTASVWSRRLASLDPLSESATREHMELLARLGERGAALAAFDDLRARLSSVLGLDPSPETVALAERIRRGDVAQRNVEPAASARALSPLQRDPGPAPSDIPRGEDGRAARGPAEGRAPRTGRGFPSRWLIAAGLAILALGVLFAPRAWQPGGRPGPTDDAPPAIAVLPFADLSEQGDRAYLSDGVSEELLNVLSRVPGLRVTARTSSFAFRDLQVTADSIGRALRVTHVLEGSVRTQGEEVRITVQLIDARDGYHVWSDTFQGDLDDIFALEDRIGAEVAQRLRVGLTAAGTPDSGEAADPEVVRLYLEGRHAWNRRRASSIRTAIDHFEAALARDSMYARAWAGLADALVVLPQYLGTDPEPWHARGVDAARRAIALDPSLAEPHATLGVLSTYQSGPAAEAHFQESLRLNPNYATAHHWYSLYFAERGRYEEQLREIRAARALDPLSPVIGLNEGKALFLMRRYDEAVEAHTRLVALEPGFGFGHAFLAEALSAAGRHAEAVAAARRALDILGEEARGEALCAAGYALARAGEVEEARRIARALEEEAVEGAFRPGAWGPAAVYAGLGDVELAMDWMERAVERDDWGAQPSVPYFDGLADHSRFREIQGAFVRR